MEKTNDNQCFHMEQKLTINQPFHVEKANDESAFSYGKN